MKPGIELLKGVVKQTGPALKHCRRGGTNTEVFFILVGLCVMFVLLMPAIQQARQESTRIRKETRLLERLPGVVFVEGSNYDQEINQYTEKPVLIFCYGGRLSSYQVKMLEQLYKNSDKLKLVVIEADMVMPEIKGMLDQATEQFKWHDTYLWVGSSKKMYPLARQESVDELLWKVEQLKEIAAAKAASEKNTP